MADSLLIKMENVDHILKAKVDLARRTQSLRLQARINQEQIQRLGEAKKQMLTLLQEEGLANFDSTMEGLVSQMEVIKTNQLCLELSAGRLSGA